MASVVFFIQHILLAVERFLVDHMTINKEVRNWAHVKSSMIERRDPLCRFFTQPQTCLLSRFFFSLLQLDRLQLTAVCCNRRVVCEHHTSHFVFSHWITRTCVAQVACLSCAHHVSSTCVCSDSLRLLHFLLSAHHLLSYHPALPPAHQLHLPGCGGQIPCAHSLMRTLAPLPSTTLSHLFQSVGCVRNKLQFRTVQQNQKSFPRMQDWGWMVYPLLIYGIWSSPFFTETRIRVIKHGETCVRTNVQFVLHFTQFQKRKQSQGVIDDLDTVDFIPSSVNSSRQEALLYLFEDNEAVIKMIIKRRCPTMRHVSRIHRVALNWMFDRINLDSKIQIKYIDTKNQLEDILTNGNYTRDAWNHLLCLFNISHFSSAECSEVMSKRTQKDAGEERVTAKPKPMMNLVSRCSERHLHVLVSTASESPEKTRYESQLSWTEQHLRTVRLVKDAYSSSFSEWNAEKNWSSQEWKFDCVMEVRTKRLVNEQPPGLFTAHGQIYCWWRWNGL